MGSIDLQYVALPHLRTSTSDRTEMRRKVTLQLYRITYTVSEGDTEAQQYR